MLDRFAFQTSIPWRQVLGKIVEVSSIIAAPRIRQFVPANISVPPDAVELGRLTY